uniref:Putative secreted protein n=1 Tax=Panstrongylus lignarius TaxID=156445 RepID=A0A224XTU4_9HEMI
MLQYIVNSRLSNFLILLLLTILRIFITLSVADTNGECSFRKLKLINIVSVQRYRNNRVMLRKQFSLTLLTIKQ